ncbi:helix-turn-helix domain-containing protein [Enterococcus gallinarum]|nr:helix-turn-helix domain-containing protein [Enterococcus gallinarum]
MNQIEYVFYHSSIKFQVLEHVLINQEIATIPLAQKLMISESSLFRKIKELNQVLAEFGLEIWQGKLMGKKLRFAIFIFSCFGT